MSAYFQQLPSEQPAQVLEDAKRFCEAAAALIKNLLEC